MSRRKRRYLLALAVVLFQASLPNPALFAYAEAPILDRIFFQPEDPHDPRMVPGRTLNVEFLSFESDRFIVDSARASFRLICVHFCAPGSSYVLSAQNTRLVRAVLVDGARSSAIVAVPIPPSLPWGIYRAQAIAHASFVVSSKARNQELPDSSQDVSVPTTSAGGSDDLNLRKARHAYLGRTVQAFGDLTLDCDDPERDEKNRKRDALAGRLIRRLKDRGSPAAASNAVFALPPGAHESSDVGNEPSLVVAAVDRPTALTRDWKIGGAVSNRFSTDDHFVSVSPLKVTFEVRSSAKSCTKPHLWVADTWELERTLWIHAPTGHARSTRIVPGLSKFEVAHIQGFPAVFGTEKEVLALDEWRYLPILPPFDSKVDFVRGRVRSYRPYGSPP